MAGHPARKPSACPAASRSRRAICERSGRDSATAMTMLRQPPQAQRPCHRKSCEGIVSSKPPMTLGFMCTVLASYLLSQPLCAESGLRQSRDHKSLEPRDAGRRQGRRGYLTIENRGSAAEPALPARSAFDPIAEVVGLKGARRKPSYRSLAPFHARRLPTFN
jgi:hypothetical protein